MVKTPAQPINRSVMWSEIGCGVASDDMRPHNNTSDYDEMTSLSTQPYKRPILPITTRISQHQISQDSKIPEISQTLISTIKGTAI